MRQVLFVLVALLFAVGCGGGGGGSDDYVEPETGETGWQGEGIFLPSDNFYQVCADISKAYDQETAVQGTYGMKTTGCDHSHMKPIFGMMRSKTETLRVAVHLNILN